MKINKHVSTGVMALLFALLSACSTTTDPSEAYKDETPTQIFDNGEKALHDKDYAEAIKRFEALDVQYPFGRNTETAQLHIIYAYYKNSDYLSAETAADRFIHAHPTSSNVDYAYYMRGLANYYQNMGVFERLFSVDYATRDLTQVKKSFNDFAKLEQQFSHSPYAPAAHQYMIYLRNVLANHQVEVAQFYFDRQAYVAAANRASIVVENYQGSPVVPDALVMMAKSYHQLHQVGLEQQTIQVIRYNFPNSRYADEVSDKQIAKTNFQAVTKKELVAPKEIQPAVPPRTGMQSVQAYNQLFPSNGARGSVTPVGDLVRNAKQSDVFASHPASATTTPMIAPQNGSRSTSVAAQDSGESSTVLSRVWDKVVNSPLLAVHDKTAPTQAAPVAQNTTTAVATPAPDHDYFSPLPGNGARR